jgi:DNA-binding CsgD family transcriptional regulator
VRKHSVLVCHPELLVAQAVAATLTVEDAAQRPVAVSLTQDLLSRLGGAQYELALVSDLIREDLTELLQALAFRGRDLPVLVMTSPRDDAGSSRPARSRPDAASPDYRDAARVLELGAIGSVSLASSSESFRTDVLTARGGGVVALGGRPDLVLQALAARQDERAAAAARLSELGVRERQVLRRLINAEAVDDVSREMGVSPHTIRASVRQLGDALGVRGQLRIAAAGRDLIAAARPPSPRFARSRAQLVTG